MNPAPGRRELTIPVAAHFTLGGLLPQVTPKSVSDTVCSVLLVPFWEVNKKKPQHNTIQQIAKLLTDSEFSFQKQNLPGQDVRAQTLSSIKHLGLGTVGESCFSPLSPD